MNCQKCDRDQLLEIIKDNRATIRELRGLNIDLGRALERGGKAIEEASQNIDSIRKSAGIIKRMRDRWMFSANGLAVLCLFLCYVIWNKGVLS